MFEFGDIFPGDKKSPFLPKNDLCSPQETSVFIFRNFMSIEPKLLSLELLEAPVFIEKF